MSCHCQFYLKVGEKSETVPYPGCAGCKPPMARNVLPAYKVVVPGDRVFCSVDLARWIARKKVNFFLRQKKSTHIQSKDEDWTEQVSFDDAQPLAKILALGMHIKYSDGQMHLAIADHIALHISNE